MSKTDWLKPLQQILNCPIHLTKKSIAEWNDLLGAVSRPERKARPQSTAGQCVRSDESVWFVVALEDDLVVLLQIMRADLHPTELELISWTLQMRESLPLSKGYAISETELSAKKLGEWIQKQLEADEPSYSLPDHLMSGNRLYNEMIPILLVTEQANVRETAYTELEKLLRSFLSEDVLLIPLKSQEWLIWGPLSLLRDGEADPFDEQEEESLEDSLASIAMGLHEMLASEWIGECQLAIAQPAVPANSLVESAIMLRETINLGRKFHVGTNIHLPWMLQLERLLNAIPESQRSKYLEQSLKRTDLFVESEMLGTLETFFELDCNVSETAKKLYIHRNTLLYRLDKLKQETGLDVRSFRDAVLVKIILLLYKVTKRN